MTWAEWAVIAFLLLVTVGCFEAAMRGRARDRKRQVVRSRLLRFHPKC